MNDQAKWRSRALRVMEKYFQSRGFPRLTLGLILIVTGLAGFGLSYLLLRAGMGAMGVRYPLAVLGAAGLCLEILAPGAKTIGAALEHIPAPKN